MGKRLSNQTIFFLRKTTTPTSADAKHMSMHADGRGS